LKQSLGTLEPDFISEIKNTTDWVLWPATCTALAMKPVAIIGIILIILGVAVLASKGITYTKTEKVIDIGPIEATAERQKTIPISPLAGGAAVAAGVILVISGSKRQ